MAYKNPEILKDIYSSSLGDSLNERTGVTYQSYIALLDEMTNLKKILDSCKKFAEKPVTFDVSVQATEFQAKEYEEILRTLASAYDKKEEECEIITEQFKAQEMKLKDSEEIIKELYEKLDKVMLNLKSEKAECLHLKQLATATEACNTKMASTNRSCSSTFQSSFKPHHRPSAMQVDCAFTRTEDNDNRCALCLKPFRSEAELAKHWKTCHANDRSSI